MMPKRKILIADGKYYEADDQDELHWYWPAENKWVVFRVGNTFKDQKPDAEHFGKKIKIVGVDIGKRLILGQPEEMDFAEIWGENRLSDLQIQDLLSRTTWQAGYRMGRLIAKGSDFYDMLKLGKWGR